MAKTRNQASSEEAANGALVEEDDKLISEREDFSVWENLGVFDTIYEEDYEFSSSSSSLSPPLSPPQNLHSIVEQWSKETGLKPDVCVRVDGKCFHLHKDPLASKSPYLKRQMAVTSDVALNPPLKITAATFTLVADFCYGVQIVVTPFNVAGLRTAAEVLEMSETDSSGGDNLVPVTEKYFGRVVAVNRDYAAVVFRSCLELLPESETMAVLASRCLEAWSSSEDEDVSCLEDFKYLEVDNFLVLASSLNRRFQCHDLIYKIALQYLNGYGGKITEDQKVLICNFIDCDKLSPKSLLHAVQNPAMPLRFIVRAMLIEQLNTRHSIFSTAGIRPRAAPGRPLCTDPPTLGAILKRDAAARESVKLKAAMHATNSRIQTLEKELSTMKTKLMESERERLLTADGGRSASFHHGGGNKVARAERGSSSSRIFRLSGNFRADAFGGCKSFADHRTPDGAPKSGKSIGQRLMNGIKSAFRVSGSGSGSGYAATRRGAERKIQSPEEEEEEEEGGDVVIRRNRLYVD